MSQSTVRLCTSGCPHRPSHTRRAGATSLDVCSWPGHYGYGTFLRSTECLEFYGGCDSNNLTRIRKRQAYRLNPRYRLQSSQRMQARFVTKDDSESPDGYSNPLFNSFAFTAVRYLCIAAYWPSSLRLSHLLSTRLLASLSHCSSKFKFSSAAYMRRIIIAHRHSCSAIC